MLELEYTVHRISPAELPWMRELNLIFFSVFEEDINYMKSPPSDAYLAEWLADDGHFALAAQVGGRVIGGLVAYELQKFEQARTEIYIYDLGVAAAYRRKGVATGLIRRLQSLAAERGASVIYVQTDRGDEAAIALYDKLGSREDVLHFDLPVKVGGAESES